MLKYYVEILCRIMLCLNIVSCTDIMPYWNIVLKWNIVSCFYVMFSWNTLSYCKSMMCWDIVTWSKIMLCLDILSYFHIMPCWNIVSKWTNDFNSVDTFESIHCYLSYSITWYLFASSLNSGVLFSASSSVLYVMQLFSRVWWCLGGCSLFVMSLYIIAI